MIEEFARAGDRCVADPEGAVVAEGEEQKAVGGCQISDRIGGEAYRAAGGAIVFWERTTGHEEQRAVDIGQAAGAGSGEAEWAGAGLRPIGFVNVACTGRLGSEIEVAVGDGKVLGRGAATAKG